MGSASAKGHTDIVRFLCALGADRDKGNGTPLFWASLQGHLKTVHYLCEAGAQKDLPMSSPRPDSFRNMTPISAAAFNGHINVVRFLCGMSADINNGQILPLRAASI